MRRPKPLTPLTPRQHQVLYLIAQYWATCGEAPAQRWIARRLGLHHSRVQQILAALAGKGWLKDPTPGGLHCTHVTPSQNGEFTAAPRARHPARHGTGPGA